MILRAAAICFVLFFQCALAATVPAASRNSEPSEEDIYRLETVVRDESAPVDWRLVSESIRRAGSGADLRIASRKEVAELLAGILRRHTPLKGAPNSPAPGIQPPLEMLKAAAIDALVRMGAARDYEFEILTVHDETKFVVLKAKAQEALAEIRKSDE